MVLSAAKKLVEKREKVVKKFTMWPELELACVREIGKGVGIENIKGNS